MVQNSPTHATFCLTQIFVVAQAFFSRSPLFYCGSVFRMSAPRLLNCIAFYFISFDVKLMGEAHAEVEGAIRGRAAAAKSNAAVLCVEEPAAATEHAARACGRPSRVGLRGG